MAAPSETSVLLMAFLACARPHAPRLGRDVAGHGVGGPYKRPVRCRARTTPPADSFLLRRSPRAPFPPPLFPPPVFLFLSDDDGNLFPCTNVFNKACFTFLFYFCSYVCLIYTVDGSSQRVPLFLLRCTMLFRLCAVRKRENTVWHALPALGHMLRRACISTCQTVYRSQGCAISLWSS